MSLWQQPEGVGINLYERSSKRKTGGKEGTGKGAVIVTYLLEKMSLRLRLVFTSLNYLELN